MQISAWGIESAKRRFDKTSYVFYDLPQNLLFPTFTAVVESK
jgi:hypothetical protein